MRTKIFQFSSTSAITSSAIIVITTIFTTIFTTILGTNTYAATPRPNATSAQASTIIFEPYFGVELQRQMLNFTKTTGNIFNRHSNQGNLFVGVAVHKNLKLEVGYTQSKKATRSVILGEDSIYLGNVLTSADLGIYKQTSQYRAAHFDLLPQIAITDNEKLKLYGIFSLCWQSIMLSTSQIEYFDRGDDIFKSTGAGTHETRLYPRGKKMSRSYGVGLDYQFSQNAGMRTNVLVTNNAKIGNFSYRDSGSSNTVLTAKLRHSAQFGIGVYAYLL